MANTKSANFGTANTNKSLSVGSSLGISDYDSITLQAWVKLNTEIAADDWGIVSWSGTKTALSLQYEYNGGAQRIAFRFHRLGVSTNFVRSTITLGTTNWYHITGTYTAGGAMELWINGVSIGTSTPANFGGSGGTAKYVAGARLGNGGSVDAYGSILVDDARVWDAVRSNTDIYNDFFTPAQLAGDEANLRAYYQFNTDLTTDLTSNAYNLTNSNSVIQSTDIPFPAVAAVTTQAVSDIAKTTATGNGNVSSDGGAAITERGVCWSTTTNPTTANSKATAAGTTGAFTAAMTGLSAGTHYYVRAYAINSVGTSYGANVEFDTLIFYAISGIVYLESTPVSGAIVRCIRQSDNVAIAEQTSDADGAYAVESLDVTELYHVAVEYEAGGIKYNAPSLWDIVPIEVP